MWKKWDGTRVWVEDIPLKSKVMAKHSIFETDPATLARRQKQIDYGKNTKEYDNYLKTVPKETRTPAQPQTPDRKKKASRRAWDGEIRIWRLLLHAYDPPGGENEKSEKKPCGTATATAAFGVQPSPTHSPRRYLGHHHHQQQPYSFRGYNFARVSFSNKQL